MKKGMYFTFNLKRAINFSVTFVLFFSLVLMMNFPQFFSDTVTASASLKPTIIIDAGHGGEDGGTQCEDGTLEKDINLQISIKINDILKEKGFNTVMTRNGDYLIYDEGSSSIRQKKRSDIHNRMKIIKENGACIFLSVHQNFFKESKYSGAQVFYSPNSPESELLAREIQESVVTLLQPENTRQIKKSGSDIYLLYNSVVPSVMVECGFMSNKAEAQRLKDDTYQMQMAMAICEGLVSFTDNILKGEKNNGSENKKYFRMQ